MHNFPSTAQGHSQIDAPLLYRLWDAEEDQHYKHTRRWPTWDGASWATPIHEKHVAMVAVRTIAGQGQVVTANGYAHTLPPDTLIIVPWASLKSWRTVGNHWRLMWFEFFVTAPKLFAPAVSFNLPYTDLEESRIATIQRLLRRPSHDEQRLASALFTALLYTWVAYRKDPFPERHRDQRIERIINTMHERINENVSVAEFAKLSGLTLRAFTEAFERATGTPPKRYFQNLRFEAARNLMMTGRYKVQRVAEHMNFASAAHFSRVYKQHFGHPPSRAH